MGRPIATPNDAVRMMMEWIDIQLECQRTGELRKAVVARRNARVWGRIFLDAIRDDNEP